MNRIKNPDWKKQIVKPGQWVAVYPNIGDSYVGKISKVTKNKYGRISYFVEGKKLVFAEELYPKVGQKKLKIPYEEKV
jgi:hypothetical protein